MKTVSVKFNLPGKPPRSAIMEKFVGAANNKFKGMDGLFSKQFTYDKNTGDVHNIYLWESQEQAEAFYSPAFIEHLKETFGVEPTITYLDILVLVDNRAGDILENNQ